VLERSFFELTSHISNPQKRKLSNMKFNKKVTQSTTESDNTKSDTTKPDITKPDITKPDITKPDTIDSDTRATPPYIPLHRS
jgi:hypothetical protein